MARQRCPTGTDRRSRRAARGRDLASDRDAGLRRARRGAGALPADRLRRRHLPPAVRRALCHHRGARPGRRAAFPDLPAARRDGLRGRHARPRRRRRADDADRAPGRGRRAAGRLGTPERTATHRAVGGGVLARHTARRAHRDTGVCRCRLGGLCRARPVRRRALVARARGSLVGGVGGGARFRPGDQVPSAVLPRRALPAGAHPRRVDAQPTAVRRVGPGAGRDRRAVDRPPGDRDRQPGLSVLLRDLRRERVDAGL